MNKFIKKTLLFLAPIILIGIVLEVLLRNIPNNYSYKKKQLDKLASKISVLILGSSHANYGLNPAFLEQSAFNSSHVSQSLDYDIRILKNYENKLVKLKYLILPVDYFTLFQNIEETKEKWRIKNYEIYYGFHNAYKTSNYFEILNGKIPANLKRIKKYYLNGKSDVGCNKDGWGNFYYSKDQLNLEETGREAAMRQTVEHQNSFEKNRQHLDQIIQYSKAKKISLILYTSPAYKSYVNSLDSAQLNKTYSCLQELIEANKEVYYHNFLTDSRFVAKDFYDGNHLNEIGAKKFTIIMDSIINQIRE